MSRSCFASSPTSTGQHPIFRHAFAAFSYCGSGSSSEINSPPVACKTVCVDANVRMITSSWVSTRSAGTGVSLKMRTVIFETVHRPRVSRGRFGRRPFHSAAPLFHRSCAHLGSELLSVLDWRVNETGPSFTLRSIASSQTCSPVSRANGWRKLTFISSDTSCDSLRTRHSVCIEHGSRSFCAALYCFG